MKIIGQYEKEEIVKFLNRINNIDDYVQNKEIYSYFLYEIFEKEFRLYLKSKDYKLYQELNSAIKNDNALLKLQLKNKANQKYIINFHKERKKFYKYKGKVYSYYYLGDFNVGHVIEIYEYNSNDLVSILNSLINKKENEKKQNFLRRIFAKNS